MKREEREAVRVFGFDFAFGTSPHGLSVELHKQHQET
jgi:DNA polymerase I-like protein with 3'-5' exonuclease and polymerase domains